MNCDCPVTRGFACALEWHPRSSETGTAFCCLPGDGSQCQHSRPFRVNLETMSQPTQPPRVVLTSTPDYREIYANSVQVRVSVWDFLLTFGTAQQQTPEEVTIQNQQGVYLSPQQAKALWNMLGQNLEQYERTFGNIALEPLQQTHGPVH